MNCANCGAYCPEGTTFCQNCGAAVLQQSHIQDQPPVNPTPYQPPVNPTSYQPPVNPQLEEPVSVSEWFLSTLLMVVPIVNIVMVFVWAFGGGSKKSKSNYFKAYLIWIAIGVVIGIIATILLTTVFSSVLYYFF